MYSNLLFGLLVQIVLVSAQMDNIARIVGGTASAESKWPFIAALMINDHHYCGGVVWNQDTIVTAAHCVCWNGTVKKYKSRLINVYLGHTNLENIHSDYLFGVSKVIVHRNYHWKNFQYDIAILKLTRPIDFGGKHNKVRCVCDPEPLDSVDHNDCVALGWGSTRAYHNQTALLSKNLLEVKVPLLPTNSCRKSLNFNSHWNVCAGTEGKDSCKVCRVRGILPPIYSLVGITSYGTKACGEAKNPGYYVRVNYFTHWIEKQSGET